MNHASDESWAREQAARLGLEDSCGFDEGELASIERAAAMRVDEPARSFLRLFGGTSGGASLARGSHAGRVLSLLDGPAILDYLADIGPNGFLPFATCLMGDLFFIKQSNGNQVIVLAELPAEGTVILADSFEDFVNHLDAL